MQMDEISRKVDILSGKHGMFMLIGQRVVE